MNLSDCVRVVVDPKPLVQVRVSLSEGNFWTDWEMLQKEYRRQAQQLKKKYGQRALHMVLRKCLGCKKRGNARWMRSHKCPSKMSYHKRQGMVFDSKTKRYVWPA